MKSICPISNVSLFDKRLKELPKRFEIEISYGEIVKSGNDFDIWFIKLQNFMNLVIRNGYVIKSFDDIENLKKIYSFTKIEDVDEIFRRN